MPLSELHTTTSDAYLPEELGMAGMSFERWEDPEYWMRADEARIFLDCLNNSYLAKSTGVIFSQTPDEPLAAALRTARGSMAQICEMVSDLARLAYRRRCVDHEP